MLKLYLFLFIFLFAKVSVADIDFTKIELGSAPKQTQEFLIENKFMFVRFDDEGFVARKTVVLDTDRGTELPNVPVSTTVDGKFCSGKLYQVTANSFYAKNAKIEDLWTGRKKIYQYLKDNEAILAQINTSKKEDGNVGLKFIIDRNSGSGNVKGEETVVSMIDTTFPKSISMKYRFENKWFCPE